MMRTVSPVQLPRERFLPSKNSVCSHDLRVLAIIKFNQKSVLEVHWLQNSESVVA
jgi:hypothetical protein